MKKLYFSFFAIFIISTSSFAQFRLVFNYDEAGNQTRQEIIHSRICPPPKTQEPIPRDFFENRNHWIWKQIKIFPIPVESTLYLRFSSKAATTVSKTQIYAPQFSPFILRNIYINNPKDLLYDFPIDMTMFNPGMYILRLELTDGAYTSRHFIKK